MARKAKGWKNNRSDIPDEPGKSNPDHPDHDPDAATATAEPKSRRKPKQKHLPGLEPPSIPKIEKLADTYVERRNERMAMLESEIAAKDLLFAAMNEAGLKHYEYDGKIIDVVAVEKVKVKKAKSEDDENEGDDDE